MDLGGRGRGEGGQRQRAPGRKGKGGGRPLGREGGSGGCETTPFLGLCASRKVRLPLPPPADRLEASASPCRIWLDFFFRNLELGHYGISVLQRWNLCYGSVPFLIVSGGSPSLGPPLIGFCNGCWLHSGLDLPYRVSFAVSTVIGAFRRTKQRSVTGQRRAWKRGCIPEGKHHKSGEYIPTKNGSSQPCSVRYVDKACQLQTLDSPKHSSQIPRSQKLMLRLNRQDFFTYLTIRRLIGGIKREGRRAILRHGKRYHSLYFISADRAEINEERAYEASRHGFKKNYLSINACPQTDFSFLCPFVLEASE